MQTAKHHKELHRATIAAAHLRNGDVAKGELYIEAREYRQQRRCAIYHLVYLHLRVEGRSHTRNGGSIHRKVVYLIILRKDRYNFSIRQPP
jgi:hypothetical protein